LISPELIQRRREDELERVERQKDRRLQLIQIVKDIAIENRKLLQVSEAVDVSVEDLITQAKKLEFFVE
jgi:hypothetical protein|tara:strand:- start:5039 stop:5245 length:207 start_codon:yes stop_codon:yes gene_type:complete